MKNIIAMTFSGAIAVASLPAFSGTEPPPLQDTAAIQSLEEAGGWWFHSTMHSWMAGIDGDVGIRGLSADVDASIGDVLDNLDFAYMTHLEFGYNRWGIGLDGVYAKLSSDADFDFGPVRGNAAMELEQAFVTARVQYRLVETGQHSFDLFGGIRWSFLDVDTDIHAAFSFDRPALQRFNGSGSRRFDFSEDWVDPIVGFRSIIGLSDSWFFQVAGDVGGFGAASDLTWQAVGAIGYRFTPNVSVLLGYRALGVDYEDDGFKIDTVNHGPALALGFKF